MSFSGSSGQLLREADIIVHQSCIDYSQKDKNPMDLVGFIGGDNQRVPHKQDEYTLLLTNQYQVAILDPSLL